jgi:hypothetical protein
VSDAAPQAARPGADRLALLIATSEYKDPTLQTLVSPGRDVSALRRVLADPAIGGFTVQLISNRGADAVRRRIDQFFAERRPADTVICYFSGHGLKDDDGNLYIAARDTSRALLRSTAISDEFLRDVMRGSRAKSQVLILDCCFGGAFSRAMLAKGSDQQLDVNERFQGTGRVVLTASTAMQFAYEGDEITGQPQLSVFTRTIVEGLSSGDADSDGDGLVSVQNLYDYLHQNIAVPGSHQTPTISAVGQEGTIFLASASHRRTDPGPLGRPGAESVDLRPFAGIVNTSADYQVAVVAVETSLAYQGHRVAIDVQQFFAALSASAMAAQEDAIYYRHDDLIGILEKMGVESDPHGRRYRVKAVPVRTNRKAISELRLGRPLLAGTSIRNTWLEPAAATSGIIPASSADSYVLGGKTLGILGYDARVDAFIILLGRASWGINGFGLLPAAQAFGGSIHDAHAIEAYEYSPAAAAADRPA